MKIVYIISKIDKSIEFENTAIGLKKAGFDMIFISLFPNPPSQLKGFLEEHEIPCYELKYTSKYQYFGILYRIYKLLKKIKPDIVHCHLIDATVIGLRAAKYAGIEKRIYTRHHSSFHHQSAPHGVKYDKWSNRTACKVIAVSKKVKEILIKLEGVPAEKIEVVNHGIWVNDFVAVKPTKIGPVNNKYKLGNHFPVIGSVSRYDEWKGVQYTIMAFKLLLEEFPNAKLILANSGKGNYVETIVAHLKELPEDSYVEIPFENDVMALYKCIDLLVHVPVDDHSEAFGLVYIEPMAAHVPIVATRSGIGNEILEHLKNSYVVDYRSPAEIAAGVAFLINNPDKAKEMTADAFEMVNQNFGFHMKLDALSNIYKSL